MRQVSNYISCIIILLFLFSSLLALSNFANVIQSPNTAILRASSLPRNDPNDNMIQSIVREIEELKKMQEEGHVHEVIKPPVEPKKETEILDQETKHSSSSSSSTIFTPQKPSQFLKDTGRSYELTTHQRLLYYIPQCCVNEGSKKVVTDNHVISQ